VMLHMQSRDKKELNAYLRVRILVLLPHWQSHRRYLLPLHTEQKYNRCERIRDIEING